MWEPGSFNIYKNVTAPIIVILGCLELDIEVSNTGMKTAESNDCREMLRNDRDTNSMLAIIRKGARFSCKDGWNFINLFI